VLSEALPLEDALLMSYALLLLDASLRGDGGGAEAEIGWVPCGRGEVTRRVAFRETPRGAAGEAASDVATDEATEDAADDSRDAPL
jgi:hypothetical protein